MSTSKTMIWMVASIFYAYQYILRVMPSVMMDDILQQFNINSSTYGQFSGIYYIGYALMHLPLGILLHRYGPKKVMPICILITVIGLLPIIFATHWIYPLIGRALIGIGSSAAILGLFNIIRNSFSEEKFTTMLSYSVIIGLIGAIYGGGPINYMCHAIGYKNVVAVFAAAGVVLSAVTYLLVPDTKEYTVNTSIKNDIFEVVGNFKVVAFCIFAGLMVGPLEGFADVWGKVFLSKVYGLEDNISASLPSLMFLGMGIGAPVLSMIAERSKNHLAVIIISALVMIVSFTIILITRVDIEILYILFFIIGMCSAYQVIAVYKASSYVKKHVVNLTTSFANMIIMLFGYFFHSLIGLVISYMGGHEDVVALKYGVAVIPGCLLLAFIGMSVLALLDKKKI